MVSMCRGAPDSREPDDPPLVWKRRAPEGYITPSYGLGWRLGWYDLYDYLDPSRSGEIHDLAYVRTNVIPSRWKDLGFADKFGWSVEPHMFICPYNPRHPLEVVVHVFTNGTKEKIEASQRPEAAEIIEAARHILGLDVEGAPDPKWRSFIRRSQSK